MQSFKAPKIALADYDVSTTLGTGINKLTKVPSEE